MEEIYLKGYITRGTLRCEIFAHIEYDYRAEKTYLTEKIIGETVVYGSLVLEEDGNAVEALRDIFYINRGDPTNSNEVEFNRYQIGQKV